MELSSKWLENSIFYEVYPQSFMDSNGDGIGDIKGIEGKLEYIKSIGCNGIWINPCFASPFQDAGYDVSDYYKVAPRYGSNADMKSLFAKAKKLGIRILLDLVPGHTSNQHPWFIESCKAKKNKYTNWFIWTDSVWNGAEPLKSISGYAERNGQYITNFFWFQPALNYGFANPDPDKKWQLPVDHPDVLAVKQEIKNIIRFWLDMGADGFRVDMAGSLVKNDDNLNTATSQFWREIRKMLDKDYPEAVLISEWGVPDLSIQAGFHMDFMLHFGPPAYNSLFRNGENSFFNLAGKGDVTVFSDYYAQILAKTKGKGYVCIPSGNHDMERLASAVGENEDTIKTAFVFLLTMPGIPFIYYGDEIGMRHLDLVSKEGGYNRTGARTPMQWNASQKNHGFSIANADKLYLPLDKSKSAPSVARQEKNPDSLLNFIKNLCRIRKENPVLGAKPGYAAIYAEKGKYPFVFMRRDGRKKALVALNPSSRKCVAKFANPGIVTEKSVVLIEKDTRIRSVRKDIELRMGPSSYIVVSGE